MPTCCGQERETTFCPDCGKKVIDDNSLAVLARQCRATAAIQLGSARKMRARAARYAESNPRASSVDVEQAEKRERIAAKWQAWADKLDALPPELKGRT